LHEQECELTDTYCTPQDVDVIFTKVKPHGARKITFRDFEHALTLIGAKKFPELDPVSGYYYSVDMVIAHGGPEARATVRIVSPFTLDYVLRMLVFAACQRNRRV
jgi:p25-alpha